MTKKEPWKSYGESKDVTDKVKERGGIPEDDHKDASPDWFRFLDGTVKRFVNDVTDAAITEAARRFKETGQAPRTEEEERKARFDRHAEYNLTAEDLKDEPGWGYGMSKEPPVANDVYSDTDPLSDALADLFTAGKKVLRAFVNEVLD